MAVKLLCLYLLLALLSPSWAEKQTCLTSASNCIECIQSGPQCAWCISPYAPRCDTVRELERAGCDKRYIYNPQGGVQVVRNDSSTEPADTKALFLQPQEMSLLLRPGVSQSFPLSITLPTDQPITEMSMDISPVPTGVNITFSNIMKGNPLIIQVNIETAQCGSEAGSWGVHITPKGFSQSLKLDISMACQCDSIRNQEEDFCRSGPNAPVCSNQGNCEGGICICHVRENPDERLTGMYCECSNFRCPYHNNRICGGHGTCNCGICNCDMGWADDDCSCSLETASCMASNGQICNGRGLCLCGTCQCDSPIYSGPTCESCLICEGGRQ